MFLHGNFAASHSECNRPMQPVLYSLFIETTAKHDTPMVVTPPPSFYDSPLCKGLLARKIPEASIVDATALRCILVKGSIVKEEKKEEETSVLHYGIT